MIKLTQATTEKGNYKCRSKEGCFYNLKMGQGKVILVLEKYNNLTDTKCETFGSHSSSNCVCVQ